MSREQINSKTLEMLDNENIKEIQMRKIGLLDVFGKIEIDITYNNNSKKELVAISPVDTNQIKEWLEKNNLLDKARLYEF
jgi:ribosomal protein S8